MTVRVLIVEDSLIAQAMLKRLLHHPPQVEVVGVANTGLDALQQMGSVQPDVICTDLHMPKMNGLELTQAVMARSPIPILVFSASVQPEDTRTVFKLLEAGAVDVFPKPRIESPESYAQLQKSLLQRIQVLAGVTVFTRKPRAQGMPQAPAATQPTPFQPLADAAEASPAKGSGAMVAGLTSSMSMDSASMGSASIRSASTGTVQPLQAAMPPRVVAIGASTGGPQALKTILSQLPAAFPLPVLCVQHISPGFLAGLTDWLQTLCPLKVQIARAGDRPQAGNIYFAPEQLHLELDRQGCFVQNARALVDGHRPSVTVLFEAVATYYRAAALGVLLTGMGKDGAQGLKVIHEAGGQTIAQDQASSVVFGMPQAAIALGAVQRIAGVGAIAPLILQKCQVRRTVI
ncbi:MAG: chemotaxis-specific protein-glutamate methyltransferase CheB [Spirulinaceae cyanobacterium]